MHLDRALSEIANLFGLSDSLTDVQGVRDLFDGFAAFLNDDLPTIGGFHAAVPYKEADGQALTLDVMQPTGQGPFPTLVYFHGGAWVWGSPATHRKLTYRLAQQGFLTLSVDYRLAPEHPFPAAFHDCIHAIYFASNQAAQWEGDPHRIVVAGDSAGANLAAAAAIELANTPGAPAIAAVGLLYGVFDFSALEADDLTRLLVEAYLGDSTPGVLADPRVSPIVRATSLPPAFIGVGSGDPLIEDAVALRSVLARAGKVHDYHVYEDMPHAFAQLEFLPDARRAIRQMSNFLHEAVNS